MQLTKDIVVVSLFDGLSGGRLALSKIPNVNVLRYYSSEVDKYSISIADKNHPQDTPYRLGDVTKVNFKELKNKIRTEFKDTPVLLIGGSPCQGFSMSGKLKGTITKSGIDVMTYESYEDLKTKGFEFDGQSYLFWEYIRALKEIQPEMFMLENVKVTNKWLPMFNETLGTKPLLINSSLVSAQNRPRYYWTNIKGVTLPTDKDIKLLDILEDVPYGNTLVHKSVKPSVAVNIISNEKLIQASTKDFYTIPVASGFSDNKVGLIKTPCLRAGNSSTYIYDGKQYRMLTPVEWERLQNVPDNYTAGVSNTQRYRMLGNGWTIDVVSHVLSSMA